jgi:tRNA modification GTPase
MNQLARREVAIVSPHAGTTRDVIEVQLDLDGYPVTLIDTAGIRETDDPVEQEGVRRARARAAAADLVLWLAEDRVLPPRESAAPVWLVRNKVDLDKTEDGLPAAAGEIVQTFRISAIRGDGVAALIASLVVFAETFFSGQESGLITRARQRVLLQETADALRRCINVIADGEELAAEELRQAAYGLGRLLGRVDIEDILDVIFREFCIGK